MTDKKKIKAFQKDVWKYYKKHGRSDLPWRKKNMTPYQVLVSEIMLQQTQVDRVIPKYKAFLKAFPSFKSLADAHQREVLKLWSGLGYNRRALNLKRTAEIVTSEYSGRLPQDRKMLESLPGIGPYIAGAVRAFAWNEPEVFIETNIRTVFIHHFFSKKKQVSDDEIFPLIEETLDRKNPKEWYAALMDYGSHLKRTLPNPSRKSKHHITQSPFKGSDRELRGKIIKLVTTQDSLTYSEITKKTQEQKSRVSKILMQLEVEGFLKKKRRRWYAA